VKIPRLSEAQIDTMRAELIESEVFVVSEWDGRISDLEHYAFDEVERYQYHEWITEITRKPPPQTAGPLDGFLFDLLH